MGELQRAEDEAPLFEDVKVLDRFAPVVRPERLRVRAIERGTRHPDGREDYERVEFA